MSDTRSATCLLHLIWAPLGTAPVESFAGAYREHPAGLEHRVVVICNGFDGEEDPRLDGVEDSLRGIEHERVLLPRAVLDLEAYRQAALALDAARLCFLNSYSRPLANGWLGMLAGALDDPAVGMTGCGGSYESAYSAAPFWLRPRRRGFPPFPNPHMRSNAFMIERDLLLTLDWPAIDSKPSAWALESGRRSLTRQLADRGLSAHVVGRDGHSYPPDDWPRSATFRSGEQRNLLVADNRTDQYEQAGQTMKGRLREMAWGASVES